MSKQLLQPYYMAHVIEVGCDEAGRGCLAGPVYAAAVILPQTFSHQTLNDSKQLNEKTRFEMREYIYEQAIAWAIGVCSPEEIDQINILNASIKAMHKALAQLKVRPEHIIVDGNRFKPFEQIPHKTIVKGDSLYFSIAAASVLAKTHRDEYMNQISAEFPQYNWKKNKGYPTKEHRQAILETGISPYHRRSFRLTDEQLKLDL